MARKGKKQDKERIIDAGRLESPKDPVDPEVQDEFADAQQRAGSGSRYLARKLGEHNSRTPELSGGDIDADWESADVGEETVGGANPTPDQSVVEDLGKAVGLVFDDDEPLRAPEEMYRPRQPVDLPETLEEHGYTPGESEQAARRRRVEPIGKRRWAIAEGYIPGWSEGPEPQMTSHETVCMLNASDSDAHVKISVFFSDREPAGPYLVTVPARRTKHLRFNDLSDPEPIPRDVEYASVVESDVPIVVQHTRLDSRQAANALLSTIAYAID